MTKLRKKHEHTSIRHSTQVLDTAHKY